jgi:hypothetical protein
MQLLTPDGRRPVIVRFEDILFGFTPQALRVREPRIEAPWIKSPSIIGKKIHVRTSMGVFWTRWDKIDDVIAELSMVPLHRTNHGTFANLNLIKVPEVEANLGRPRLGFLIEPAHGEPTLEWVHVSREERKNIDDIIRC